MTRLLETSRESVVRPGAVLHWEGDETEHLEVVVSGLIRVLVTAPDGRTMTVRYCRPGALLGAMSLFTPGFAMPATAIALSETRLLRLAPDVVRDLARNADVAHCLLVELSQRAKEFLHEIPGSAFGTVRQRVARHLLDLAEEQAPNGPGEPRLVATTSQQELADAVGTAREVVVRVLRELRTESLVETRRGAIVLLDVERLVDEEIWNLSS